jgi:hypothetical protein
MIIRADFLKSYCEFLKLSRVEVLCGASVYQLNKPTRSHYLRWKYSTIRESKSLEERKQNPNLGVYFIIRMFTSELPVSSSMVNTGID